LEYKKRSAVNLRQVTQTPSKASEGLGRPKNQKCLEGA
jgi:hypothetical protein